MAGLGGVSTEAQRVAVAIADRVGGVADWTTSARDAAGMLAFQTVGAVAASYGELAERADLLLYWGCPTEPLPSPEQLPSDTIGDASQREVLVVSGDPDHQPSLQIKPGADYEAIHVLRAVDAGLELDEGGVQAATGVALQEWRLLAERLAGARYAVIVRGPSVAAGGAATVAALTQLAQQLHARARVAVASSRAMGNRLGAENVLAWQTGFPLAVDFGRGYPRYGPEEYDTQTVLSRGEVDAALVVDAAELETLDQIARNQLANLPRVVLQTDAGEAPSAEVTFRVAPLAESGGGYYRSDGLALRTGAAIDGALTAEQALRLILAELDATPDTIQQP